MREKFKKIAIYLALIVVLVVLVIVFVKILFPQPKLTVAYDKTYELSLNQDVEYTQSKLANIINDVARVDSENEKLYHLKKYQKLMQSYKNLNQTMQSGLFFNTRGKNYDKLAKALEGDYKTLVESFSVTKAYLADEYTRYTVANPSFTYADIEIYLSTAFRYIKQSLENEKTYYLRLIEIYQDGFQTSISNNNAVKTNISICKIYLDKFTAVDSQHLLTQVDKLVGQSIKDFSNVTFETANTYQSFLETHDVSELIDKILENKQDEYINDQADKEAYTNFVNAMLNV